MIDHAARPTLAPVEPEAVVRSPLRHINTGAVDAAARMEARNREVYLPPVSAYRWWARRTEAINGAILEALSKDEPGRMVVVDPFAGGGVIPLASVLRGHWTYAQDLNPWAATGLADRSRTAARGPPREESFTRGHVGGDDLMMADGQAAASEAHWPTAILLGSLR